MSFPEAPTRLIIESLRSVSEPEFSSDFSIKIDPPVREIKAVVTLSKVRELTDLSDSEASITSVTPIDSQGRPMTDINNNPINLVDTQSSPGLPSGHFTRRTDKELIRQVTFTLIVRNSDSEAVGQVFVIGKNGVFGGA